MRQRIKKIIVGRKKATKLMDFVQLHLHTYFSILDGVNSPESYVKRAKEFGMKSLGISDHGSMSGILRFSNACKKEGIKPIIGCEFYVNNTRHLGKEAEKNTHTLLLVKNKIGYRNILKINYDAMVNGFYYRGRTTEEVIFKNSKGLIATTACMGGSIARRILHDGEDAAEPLFLKYLEFFGDDFYGELIFNEVPEQIEVTRGIYKLCKKHGVKWIVTGDCHYLDKGDDEIQDMLIMINFRKSISDENVFRFSARHLWFHKPGDYLEFNKQFGFNLPEKVLMKGIENTLEVAEKCNFDFDGLKTEFPRYIDQDGYQVNADKILESKVNKALRDFDIHIDLFDKYCVRARKELGVIKGKGFSDYFLIVEDIINFCKRSNIAIGAGRGSAAGSLVSYLLGITKVDPVRFNLLFERFLNKDRQDPPDIDIDFESARKPEIEEYLKKKYGEDKVAHIITFSTIGPKGALGDVARVLEKEKNKDFIKIVKKMEGDYDKGVKEFSIPEKLKNLEWTTDQKSFIRDNKKIFIMANKIVGKIRQPGQHAGGIAITLDSIYRYIPVHKVKGSIVTGFIEGNDYRELSQLGILKLDILGIKQIDILKNCKALVKEIRDEEVDLDNIDLDDENLFEAINRYDSIGIFQFENASIDTFLKRVGPENFEDIVTVNALYRPALINAGESERYIRRRRKIKSWEKSHACKYSGKDSIFGNILLSTYGTIVFQEQFMAILNKIGKFTLGEADKARKTFKMLYLRRQNTESKKKDPELLKVVDKFRIGAEQTTNMDKGKIDSLIAKLAEFAEYSFNRSHSVSYSIITMQTLFMRENYPLCFYCSLLDRTENSEKGFGFRKENKMKKYFNYIKKRGVKFLQVDINKSGSKFYPEKNKIRIPLTFVPRIGFSLSDQIVKNAPFDSFSDFVLKEMTFKSNRTSVLNLIDIGAFDSLNSNRIALHDFYNEWASMKSRYKKKESALIMEKMLKIWKKHKDKGNYNIIEKIKQEEDICKFNIFYRFTEEEVRKIKFLRSRKKIVLLTETPSSGQRYLVTFESRFEREKLDKNGNPYKFYNVEDWRGNVREAVSFYKTYPMIKMIRMGKCYLLEGYPEKDNRYLVVIGKKHGKSEDPAIPLERLKNI